MAKGQTDRLTKEKIRGGGPQEIFGGEAQEHDKGVGGAAGRVLEQLVQVYPNLEFRHRWAVSKKEINKVLSTIDNRMGKTLFVPQAKIKPDGGLIEVKDSKGKWRIVLVSEAKHQGKDVQNIEAGTLVGKNQDQDLMVAGNAIERVHKNINEIRNLMIAESHFPYVVFLQGSNFATSTFEAVRPDGRKVTIRHDKGSMNRIDRVSAASFSMPINENHCRNIIVTAGENTTILQAASLYVRAEAWTNEEMMPIMLEIANTSLAALAGDLNGTPPRRG